MRELEQLEQWRKETADRLEQRKETRKKVTIVVERSLRNVERKLKLNQPESDFKTVSHIVKQPGSDRLYEKLMRQSEERSKIEERQRFEHLKKIKERHRPIRFVELQQHFQRHDAQVAEQQELRRQERQGRYLHGLRVYEIEQTRVNPSSLSHSYQTKVAKQVK